MHDDIHTELGLNRTGNKTSPIDSEKTKEGAINLTIPPKGDASGIAQNRIDYVAEADGVGSIPIPTSLRGVASSIQEKFKNGSHLFMDKLGERLAFERSGTRLYEALLSKYHASPDKKRLPELGRIEQFYLEELKHYQLLIDVINKVGGDPTAITPAADVAGVAASGWVQVISDPRTNFLQSLEIILQAELVDNCGWELLIELAERTGLNEYAIFFQQSLDEEAFHLITVKQWVQELTLNDEIISPEQNFVIEIDMDQLIKH